MSTSEQRMIKLEGLTDGVFAIVMTLLVLGLGVPVFKGSSMHQEFTQLLEMWPKFASYVVTFLVLGFTWSVHHRILSLMKRLDMVSVWLEIICMMFAALLPFSTSLLAEYMGQQLPTLIYEGNFFMCALIGYVNWLYVTGKYRLVDTNIDLRVVRERKIMFLSAMVFTAIAIGVSYLNTIASMIFFVVCFTSVVIYSTLRFRIRIIGQIAK